MKRFLWSCAALLTLFTAVQSLSCNTCEVGILGYCLYSAPVNCTSSQDRCYNAVAKFSADFLDIHEGGCTEKSDCVNSSGTILTVNYTITRSCCSSNLCNRAATSQPPVTAAALAAALLAVWSQWGL